MLKLGNTIGMAAVVAVLAASSAAQAGVPADNTARNDADRSRQGQKPTADQSGNGKSDLDITAQIRRAVMADKGLSTSAHNVKIIVQSGIVTLKGPVKSNSEKMTVEKKACDVAGAKNVRNEIEIER